jgi:hypothetical protein
MLPKDLKRFNLLISSSLTAVIEAGINSIPQPTLRQILSPLSVLVAFCIATFVIHRIKGYSQNLLIKNREEEIMNFSIEMENSNNVNEKNNLLEKMTLCRTEIVKFKREKSKIDFF